MNATHYTFNLLFSNIQFVTNFLTLIKSFGGGSVNFFVYLKSLQNVFIYKSVKFNINIATCEIVNINFSN